MFIILLMCDIIVVLLLLGKFLELRHLTSMLTVLHPSPLFFHLSRLQCTSAPVLHICTSLVKASQPVSQVQLYFESSIFPF